MTDRTGDPKSATRNLARTYADKGDPNGWFEEFYAQADGDIAKVYWADLKPHSLLQAYLRMQPCPAGGRAVTIGCGLGDDAELLARHRWQVTAFDISLSAISMCRQRFPRSDVDYRVADLFDHPAAWTGGFDLVFECNTIQILVGDSRLKARQAIAAMVAPGGTLVVSCRSRNAGEGLDVWPLALDREEIDGFGRAGLVETEFAAYDDDQEPPVPHFFAVYRRGG